MCQIAVQVCMAAGILTFILTPLMMNASAGLTDITDPNPMTFLAIDGTPVTLDLKEHKVPSYATSVMVYARVMTGSLSGDKDGDVLVTSGQSTRRLFFHTYRQEAWSYNSDYFLLPIAVCRTVTARVVTDAKGGNFRANVQVVGYESA